MALNVIQMTLIHVLRVRSPHPGDLTMADQALSPLQAEPSGNFLCLFHVFVKGSFLSCPVCRRPHSESSWQISVSHRHASGPPTTQFFLLCSTSSWFFSFFLSCASSIPSPPKALSGSATPTALYLQRPNWCPGSILAWWCAVSGISFSLCPLLKHSTGLARAQLSLIP